MSEAENLLNQISEEDVSTYTADPIKEGHIVIDENRIVTVPAELKRIGVQHDHNIETVTFDCPRYWDGIDMSEMKVYINYMRADGGLGMFHAETVTIDEADETIMHFDWVISSNVTAAKGSIKFLVCIVQVNDEGDEERHWNSELNTEMTVSEGLETGDVIVDMNPDIITQLLVNMDKVTARANSVEQEVIFIKEYTEDNITDIRDFVEQMYATGGGTVPVDQSYDSASIYAQSGKAVAEAVNETSIKGIKSGEVVILDDISQVEHNIKIKATGADSVIRRGKNLIPYPYKTITDDTKGVTWKDNGDGTLIANGTAYESQSYVVSNWFIVPKGTYTLSGHITAQKEANCYVYISGRNHTPFYADQDGKGATFTLEEDMEMRVVCTIQYTTVTDHMFKPQLELGAVATEYEPYVEPVTFPVNVDGTVDGVTSIYPTTVLTTDTEGVTIEAEYNRDVIQPFTAIELLETRVAEAIAVVNQNMNSTDEEVERIEGKVDEVQVYAEQIDDLVTSIAIPSEEHPGCFYRNVITESGFSTSEWINPPMEEGVEYRTTERFLGKPVYTKLIRGCTESEPNLYSSYVLAKECLRVDQVEPICFNGTFEEYHEENEVSLLIYRNLANVCDVDFYREGYFTKSIDVDVSSDYQHRWGVRIKPNDEDATNEYFTLTVKYAKETNLLDEQYYDSRIYDRVKTVNGITFTDNDNGTVTVNGTATADATFLCIKTSSLLLPEGQYGISSGVSNDEAYTKYGVVFGYTYQEQSRKTAGTVGGLMILSRLEEQALCDVSIVIRKGQTVNNLVFKPRLERIEDIS